MYFSHLALMDFRSYQSVEVEFEPGISTFVGANGQGKTNLIEALGYVATLSSHRVPTDAALVRSGASRALVRTRIVRGDRASTVEVEIVPGKSNRARINRAPATRARDVIGIARTVLFAPEDLGLVKGEPEARRRFIDQLAILLRPRMAALFSDYDRVMRQRNALLRSSGPRQHRHAATRLTESSSDDGSPAMGTLDIWDARLAALGGQILEVRCHLAEVISPLFAAGYRHLSGGQSDAQVSYRSSADEALGEAYRPGVRRSAQEWELLLRTAMTSMRHKELERGVCLVGPHRDDVMIAVDNRPAKSYASHGESWSCALALRLASYDLMRDSVADLVWAPDWGVEGEPVLILDDVFAELDAHRRHRLAGLIADAGQVIITAAVDSDIPPILAGARYDVHAGAVHRVRS